MIELEDLLAQVKRLSDELDKRCRRHEKDEPYYEGECPPPPAITEARLTKAYRFLMPVSEAAWGSLVVDSVLDRLEPSGIRDIDQGAADQVWGLWQDNGMDAESKLGHGAALLDGRAFALVWTDPGTGRPEISLDDCTQMVVQYREGSRRKRVAALRRWKDESGSIYANLYRPEGIYKFKATSGGDTYTSPSGWERLEVEDENWPLENPLGEVPVVEVAVNRRLKPGSFGYARGEYAHCIGLIDRINLLTFLGLVVAFWMGFPLRGVIGYKPTMRVLTDDDGEPILDSSGSERTEAEPPFDVHADSIFALPNPESKIAEYTAADRKNLSIFAELDQLAVLTKTPRHYFPLEQGMSNLSADAIRASEGSLHAKVTGHKASLGEGWEEVLRLAGKIMDAPVELSPRAELQWRPRESRSLGEQADAFGKLAATLPWTAAAELALNVTQEQITRWEGQQAMGPLGQLVAAAQEPVNGNQPLGVPTG